MKLKNSASAGFFPGDEPAQLPVPAPETVLSGQKVKNIRVFQGLARQIGLGIG
jgi:hypothetical protein